MSAYIVPLVQLTNYSPSDLFVSRNLLVSSPIILCAILGFVKTTPIKSQLVSKTQVVSVDVITSADLG